MNGEQARAASKKNSEQISHFPEIRHPTLFPAPVSCSLIPVPSKYLLLQEIKTGCVSTGSKQHQLKVRQLLTDLQSGDETKINTAIKSFHVHGDAVVITPMLEVWRKGLSVQNEAAILELFEGLKDTTTIDPLMEGFRAPENEGLKRRLVTAFWNSKLDFSPYLADFVLFAVEGDFLDAFEALTLIEQFTETIPESAIMESQLLLKEYFGGIEGHEEKKDALLKDLALHIKDFEADADMDELFFEE